MAVDADPGRRRPRKYGQRSAAGTPDSGSRLTPPCQGIWDADGGICRYPLLPGEKVCPRCGTPVEPL